MNNLENLFFGLLGVGLIFFLIKKLTGMSSYTEEIIYESQPESFKKVETEIVVSKKNEVQKENIINNHYHKTENHFHVYKNENGKVHYEKVINQKYLEDK